MISRREAARSPLGRLTDLDRPSVLLHHPAVAHDGLEVLRGLGREPLDTPAAVLSSAESDGKLICALVSRGCPWHRALVSSLLSGSAPSPPDRGD